MMIQEEEVKVWASGEVGVQNMVISLAKFCESRPDHKKCSIHLKRKRSRAYTVIAAKWTERQN
jgi:hypothetical protein